MVTGPGGVLWGANSFLGIVNVITKDAEDVNGLEVSAGYGDGPGNKQDFKAYALFGKTFFNGKLKIFQHVSLRDLHRPDLRHPAVHRLDAGAAAGRHRLLRRQVAAPIPTAAGWSSSTASTRFGPVSLYYMLPFGDMHPNMTSTTSVVPSNHTWNQYDRYGVARVQGSLLEGPHRPDVKGYCIQFVRD